MGKTSNAKKGSKDRMKHALLRQQRKLMMAQNKEINAKVHDANKLDNPLSQISLAFTSFSAVNDPNSHDLKPSLVDWMVNLLERNLKKAYEESSWGWKEASKREQLMNEDARFLLVKCGNEPQIASGDENFHQIASEYCGFVHFRFDTEEGVEVLYCYEIQLEKEVQGKGVGTRLLNILELISMHTGMRKVMATVFKHNERSLAFFKKNFFVTDEISPDLNGDDSCDYVIISKTIDKF